MVIKFIFLVSWSAENKKVLVAATEFAKPLNPFMSKYLGDENVHHYLGSAELIPSAKIAFIQSSVYRTHFFYYNIVYKKNIQPQYVF